MKWAVRKRRNERPSRATSPAYRREPSLKNLVVPTSVGLRTNDREPCSILSLSTSGRSITKLTTVRPVRYLYFPPGQFVEAERTKSPSRTACSTGFIRPTFLSLVVRNRASANMTDETRVQVLQLAPAITWGRTRFLRGQGVLCRGHGMSYCEGENEHHTHENNAEGDKSEDDRRHHRKISGDKHSGRSDRHYRADHYVNS